MEPSTLVPSSRRDLSESAREDDVLAVLSRLLRQRRAALVGIARREGLPAADAVDTVQEALCLFLRTSLRDPTLRPDAELGRTLAAMVKNAARNKRRRHHVARPHVELTDDTAAFDGPDAAALVAEAEEHVRLRACVARLCDTQRAVVTLRFLEEQPGEDVAATLGIARGHVDVLLHRAKRQLRACMGEDG